MKRPTFEEIRVLRDSYNSLCDYLSNGEHVEMSWVREAIDNAARDILVDSFNKKIISLEKENAELKEICNNADIEISVFRENNKLLSEIKELTRQRDLLKESLLRNRDALAIYKKEVSDG